ncbi:MAG: dTDP-glucose 4,6-dehydratase [Akkermansia sp.]|nr:dTDP-glucose 4,6-dehydratase [Akkermansia sp.]
MNHILITGGAGFIGSHVVRHFVQHYPQYRIVNVDALTYAGHLENVADVQQAPNYCFVQADIGDFSTMCHLMEQHAITAIIHLAAESHVDRSIGDPFLFARTNVLGTLSLLEAARCTWGGNWQGKRFYHISTDEVYGALPLEENMRFTERTPYAPHSPYSASKAASDHFVRAYRDTYGMPILISNCSNNYGPYQHPEKLIPLCIDCICRRRPIPVYGKGENVRDWLHVQDHARAIDTIFHHGLPGRTYNIGADNEWSNLALIHLLIETTDRLLSRPPGSSSALIRFVADRPGHDLRYAIDASRLRQELGWHPAIPFREGIEATVRWYLEHEVWLRTITNHTLRCNTCQNN